MKRFNGSPKKALIGKNRRGALLTTASEPGTTAFQASPPNDRLASSAKFKPVMLFLLVIATACSSVQTGQQSSAISAPSPNLATVYLYRPLNSPGSAVAVDIKDNGIDIGALQVGTYFVYHANPGQHSLTATTDTASTQTIKLQAGATYYIEAAVVSRQHLFQPSLKVVFDLQGQAAIQTLKRLPYHE
jgi:Protein of unknown function (DUF2846)